ncbi:hypothetical protein [Parasitella parasitica]|uniref:RlpA-like protein double-psi beta-barrel domain-containing protein n=1 Tax=Parasitella parasitica TaxID=35722 RepID=A0A0B7NCF2_9FUNG|nr:hypothetical protein [Parasitella parasitica]
MRITQSTLLTLVSVILVALLFNAAESAPAFPTDVPIPSAFVKKITVAPKQLALDGHQIEKRRNHQNHEKPQKKNDRNKLTSTKKTSKSSSSSGTFKGKGTWYHTGMGSCGIKSNDKQLIIALNARQMAKESPENPNNNPLCGRKIRVRNLKNGREVTATVQDTCPGCPDGDSLDLSPAAFKKIAALDQGKIEIEWSWV